ncbi:MAG: hypothetical protein Q9225_002508 [Loekoesia sp. 1 TL-2023]
MATTTQLPMPDPSREIFSTPAPPVIEPISQQEEDVHPEQNRSSSLSDIEDRADKDTARSDQDLPAIDSDQNDTEAETERLEDSPQKSRETQNLVLAAANSVYEVTESTPIRYGPVEAQMGDETRQDSEAASLSDLSAEDERAAPVLNSPRKRKRSDVEYEESKDQRGLREPRFGSSMLVKTPANACLATLEAQPNNLVNSHQASDREEQESEEEIQGAQTPVTMKGKRGKRRTRKASDSDVRMHSPSVRSVNGVSEPVASTGAPDSNGDDAEMEDAGEHGGFENIIKDEESVVKKKSAIDSLGAIEKCFASLREKLYDERLAKCDAELAMLAGSTVMHPELLSMKEVLEQRRDEKIQHEDILLKYKLGSLQNKSKAEKAQVHGQYMQSVREIRDRNLEQANKEWYQIHKERRSRDDDAPEYMYQLPARRSQQITNQTAYNKEVSLLSGIAKYRGFPAAPEIRGAKPSEIDEDFEKMGIVQQPSAPLAKHPPSLRASLSVNAVLPRPNRVTDEHFFEQNPWANPQYPAHLHRQASAMSRTVSPLVTPTLQKWPTEPSGAPKSVSTLPEADTRSSLPIESTPETGQQDKASKKMKLGFSAGTEPDAQSNMPNKPLPRSSENLITHPRNQHAKLERPRAPSSIALEKAQSSGTGRIQGQEIHVKPYIPKNQRKTDSPGSASALKLPVSPSSRFPIIKAEDMTRFPGRSLTPQQYHRPVSINVRTNGAGDRLATS